MTLSYYGDLTSWATCSATVTWHSSPSALSLAPLAVIKKHALALAFYNLDTSNPLAFHIRIVV